MGICESSNNKAAAAQVQSATTALTNQANNTKPSEGISGLLGNALVPNQTQQKQGTGIVDTIKNNFTSNNNQQSII